MAARSSRCLCLGAILSMANLAAAPSPVADAAMHHDIAAVRALLAQRVDVNAPQPDGATALMWAITDAQKPLAFSLVRVTGLKSPDDWHNTGLTVIQEDNDHLTQEWSYEFKRKSGKNVFHFTRVK